MLRIGHGRATWAFKASDEPSRSPVEGALSPEATPPDYTRDPGRSRLLSECDAGRSNRAIRPPPREPARSLEDAPTFVRLDRGDGPRPGGPSRAPSRSARASPGRDGAARGLPRRLHHPGRPLHQRDIENYLVTRFPDRKYEIINLGFSGETVSEHDRARPDRTIRRSDVRERLGRVLDRVQPRPRRRLLRDERRDLSPAQPPTPGRLSTRRWRISSPG